MRGTILSTLRLMLRAEIGQTMQTAAGTQADARANQLLANKQSWLTTKYDWSFLEDEWDVAANPSDRYLNLPTTANAPEDSGTIAINLNRPTSLQVKYNTIWLDVSYGIGGQEYDYRDSDLSQTEDPIRRWRIATDTSAATHPNQFEIWPMPVTAQTLRFTGQRVPQALGSDSAKADLDDLLLVLFVAADMLLENHPNVAKLKAAAAQDLLTMLRGGEEVREEKLVLGANWRDSRQTRRVVPMIIVSH